jgi:DNA-binding transcriptional LysR family regulator
LTLTETGERFLHSIEAGLSSIQSAISEVSTRAGQPAGTLKVSMGPAFGLDYLLPLLPRFLERYPDVIPDWHFDNRRVDLIAEGFDGAIGGGVELADDIVARELAPVHVIAVASPSYLKSKPKPSTPANLAELEGICMRSANTGRILTWTMRTRSGQEMPAIQKPHLILSDPGAITRAAAMGLGVALIAVPHVLPHLKNGALARVPPGWHADAGAISLYFTWKALAPCENPRLR